MIDDMPRKLPHLQREVTRHGKVLWYVRINRGPRVRVDGEFGTPAFYAAYRNALANGAPAKVKEAVLARAQELDPK